MLTTQRWRSPAWWAALLLVLATVSVGTSAAPAFAATPAANPTIPDSCGIELTLVLDASGSVNSSHAVEDVRDAAEAMLDPLSGTGSSARVTQFATVSEQLAPRTHASG